MILQRERKEEENTHVDTRSHFSRQEVTLRGRTSPFSPGHLHTVNAWGDATIVAAEAAKVLFGLRNKDKFEVYSSTAASCT